METKYKILLFGIFMSIGLAIVWILIATRPLLFSFTDFSNTGEIGDTIGGLSAPIFNILTASLLFLSLMEQIQTNKDQQKIIADEIKRANVLKETNQIFDLYRELTLEIDKIKITGTESQKGKEYSYEYSGIKALDKYISLLFLDYERDVKEEFLRNIEYVILIFLLLIRKVQRLTRMIKN